MKGCARISAPDITADRFIGVIRALEDMTRVAHKLYAFAGLSFAADTQDQAAQSLQARVQQFLADMENRTLFFSLWWKDLDEENANRLMDESGDYRYYLEEMCHFKPHTLSEPEEKVVNLKNVTGAEALITLYSTITSRYVYKLEVEGETRELTRGELMVYAQGSDPDLRAGAYQELYRVFAEDGLVLGQLYQNRVRDWRNENLTLRKFSSPIAVRNLGNDIPDKAVDTLLDVARKNAGIFQRYFKLKANVLGMDKLRRYDIYAPVVKAEKPFEYASAARMVLELVQRVRT